MMAKDYMIFVEFRVGNSLSTTQTLTATTAMPELRLLLEALDASPAVCFITVYSKHISSLTRLTKDDLGFELEKIR